MLAHNLLINGIPICNEDRTTLMTNFKDYLVGLRWTAYNRSLAKVEQTKKRL